MTDDLDALVGDMEKVGPRWKLVFAEDLVVGQIVWYQRHEQNPDWDPEHGTTGNPLVTLFSGLADAEDCAPQYLHVDAWATILDLRANPMIVSLIMLDEDGDQVGHALHPYATIRVRA